jgi:hypothetical protein
MAFLMSVETIIQEYNRTKLIPIGLVQQAWAGPENRGAIIDMLLESLRKLGGFEKVPFWIAALSASISCDEVIELYKEIRSRSVRNELEWRLGFQTAFLKYRELLPAIEERSIRSYDLEDGLREATRENDIEATSLLIDCMLRIGLDPSAIRIASLEDLGLSEDQLQEMNGDDLAALIKNFNRERGVRIQDYAAQLGHDQIVRLLDASAFSARRQIRSTD